MRGRSSEAPESAHREIITKPADDVARGTRSLSGDEEQWQISKQIARSIGNRQFAGRWCKGEFNVRGSGALNAATNNRAGYALPAGRFVKLALGVSHLLRKLASCQDRRADRLVKIRHS